ncbi:receptor-type tyrosine-protein phosphatase F-like isoform X1 [Ruditapes philippinarum]|uniref:receptor-type tyrosine-protein phosphatase F-like isoform X1 n=1 Tax=Ruditapes philippinarum TaxID=129788 RepID=UPI00295B74C1|nr:receptor-type tyrosine-protein phosphatase F-like isoform X1 [Ruditapes philippinarum]
MAFNWIIKGYLLYVCIYILEIKSSEGGDVRDLMQGCNDGLFGYQCRYRCHCQRDAPCDKITGTCYNGCAAGYWGPGCQLNNNCFYNGKARQYQGRVSVTASLFICQRWGSQTPHRHSYKANDFPDGHIPDNSCRTTKDSSRPWCYTTDKRRRWEHCNVNNCNCPLSRFGHNCDRECHCAGGTECDSIMGICKSDQCAPGWTGFDCQTPEKCLSNTYGWECSERCYCTNPDHCDRFTGPTPQCQCQRGYFNAPFCEQVTPPRIIHFGNERENQGQASVFNCTVAAFPTPRDSEIRLLAPRGKHVTLIQSVVFTYTRSSLFQVSMVNANEKYSCLVRAVAGNTSITREADVFIRPMLINPPNIIREQVTGTEIPLEWPPWSRSRGDTGDPPIMWYSVWLRTLGESSFRMLSVVPEVQCYERSACNFTVTDLIPYTNYVIYISVRRQGDSMDGPAGPMVHVKTKCAEPTESVIITTIAGEYQVNNTYPKTKLIVHWEDAPKEAWSCDSIRKYQILVSKGEPDVMVTHVAGRAYKQFQISELEPSTHYCISMRYENNQGFFSPTSAEKCVTSPSTVLSAPRNLQLSRRTSTSLTIWWERPSNARGNMTLYTIIYWKGFVRELSTKKGVEYQSGELEVKYKLTGLDPVTSYNIQVQAVNSAGSGEYSEILVASTSEGRPGALSKFRNTSRTRTSIMLEWQPPERSISEIMFYYVKCTNSKTASVSQVEPLRIPTSMTKYNFTGLEPTTQYICSINASSTIGTGPTSYFKAWTEAVDPTEPPAPTILGRSDTTVTLDIKQHVDESISFYRIIVEQVTERSKRSVQESVSDINYDYYTAKKEGSSIYVAAQLDNADATGTFVVGDNKTYGGYKNVPLHPQEEYDIWLGAYAETDTGIRKSISKAVKGSVARSAITAIPPTSHVPVIIGVLILFIVLILVVALLLFMWRKKHLQSEREKAEMPNFGPTIIPEPDLTPPSTPIENVDSDPLLDASVGSDTDSEPIYGNIGFDVAPVKVEDLWDYVKNNKCNDCEGFRREYKLIPAGITAMCEAARKCENKNKNRYGNIVAYDHTRVVLHDYEDEHDDYINANYVDGYNKSKAYIAAQGPTKETLKDIWRMVWQEQSKTIIMLTNPTETGKKKCESYWPADEVQSHHGITVECLGTSDLPDFTTRTFKLAKDDETRVVKQFHYTTWPDHGVPKYSSSLLLLRQKIRSHDNLDAGPQVIHCSAGVGRTGSYIAIDVELERAKTEGIIDVHNFVQLMRTQRINMVQTMDQYVFVYDCLLEALISGDTLMRADEYQDILSEMCQFDNTIQKTKLEEQFEILRLITTTIERDESTTALRAENIFKNRCKNIIPANRCRPFLMTPYEGCNDYINAIFCNSYTRRDGFVLTQMPLPNTVIDFWRLIHDHNVAAIVMLNEVDQCDETCEQYWTLESCGEKYGPFIVETTAEIKSDPSITIRDFSITNTDMPHAVPKVVRQFHFHRWVDDSPVPSSKLALFELLDMVDTCQRHSGNKPVVVHCMNGAYRSGLYCAVSILIERLKLEKEIDVFQTVKQLRLCRSHLVDNLEQYRYCHEIVLDYMNSVNMNSMSTFTPPVNSSTVVSSLHLKVGEPKDT